MPARQSSISRVLSKLLGRRLARFRILNLMQERSEHLIGIKVPVTAGALFIQIGSHMLLTHQGVSLTNTTLYKTPEAVDFIRKHLTHDVDLLGVISSGYFNQTVRSPGVFQQFSSPMPLIFLYRLTPFLLDSGATQGSEPRDSPRWQTLYSPNAAGRHGSPSL
jgi:hypothetical protein